MSVITCKMCGKKEHRQRQATYCITCGNKRISAAGRAKSKIGKLKARVSELESALSVMAKAMGGKVVHMNGPTHPPMPWDTDGDCLPSNTVLGGLGRDERDSPRGASKPPIW